MWREIPNEELYAIVAKFPDLSEDQQTEFGNILMQLAENHNHKSLNPPPDPEWVKQITEIGIKRSVNNGLPQEYADIAISEANKLITRFT